VVATQTLAVWTNGQKVGDWEVRDGEHRFRYAESWVASPAARRISLSLPFMPGNAAHRGDAVRNYFDNLLPDSDAIRERLQRKYATRSIGPFELLGAIGRDCVGAVQLMAPGEAPVGFDRIEAEPLDHAGVERAIDASLSAGHVLGHRDDDDDEFRISLAGAQEKTALLQRDGRWYRPVGTTPTTHILKLPLGLVGNMRVDMQASVENEWLCSRIVAGFGLPVAHCDIAVFGARKVLVVRRFDRAMQHAGTPREWIARLPQEDFCQALGAPGALKYEADGGPGMREILRVLDGSTQPAVDKANFVKAQMLFWLLAATDGHAKNFSIFLERGGGYRLAPLYDVLSAWPVIGKGPNHISWHKAKLAMAIRGRSAHWKLADILPRHWDLVAKLAGLGTAEALRAEVIDTLPHVIASVQAQLPAHFPEQVANAVFDGMKANALRLAEPLVP
jgi:serine/threonine-protein kinase HipA